MANKPAPYSAPTNVSQVQHLSPFRYPGGKTWLIPRVRRWLFEARPQSLVLVEPFAGGAQVGLTAVAEELVDYLFLGELDDDVASVWSVIFGDSETDLKWLTRQIANLEVNLANVQAILNGSPHSNRGRAFRTIVMNRTRRGGILAAGAGLLKTADAGRGLTARWYPATLVARIEKLRLLQGKITFSHANAFSFVQPFLADPSACFFIDPPYTAGGKKAGSRLYTHSEVDHEELFSQMAQARGPVLMTYDDAPEVRELAARYGFAIEIAPMKTTHHRLTNELLLFSP